LSSIDDPIVVCRLAIYVQLVFPIKSMWSTRPNTHQGRKLEARPT
jgi:hypothetical protein